MELGISHLKVEAAIADPINGITGLFSKQFLFLLIHHY